VIGGRVFDTSALEPLDLCPGTGLGSGRAEQRPGGAHHRPHLQVLLGLPNTVLEVLDGPTAYQVGLLLATAGRSEPVAGHIAWCGRQRGWPILTAAPGPLRELDAEVEIEALP
jgi:hypothetical protein